MITRGELAEYQEVHGNFYGTPLDGIQRALERGRDVIMDIDVYGKKKLDKKFPEAIGILIAVPSLRVLRERLQKRRTEDTRKIEARIIHAKKEIQYARTGGKYEHTIVNRDLGTSVERLKKIIKRERNKKMPTDKKRKTHGRT